jgi:phage/plasmid-associated DNA primase
MQMLLGYFITGDTSQSIFTVMTSPGGSGKTILVNALRETLGPFFATLHKDVILDGKQANKGAADPNLMALQGKHLAISEETGSLAKLDESVVKYLTGDSVVNARDLFEKQKTFKLIAKVAICTNFPPKFDSTDWALLRRLIYVLFPNTYVSEENFDPTNPSHRLADVTLNDKLKTIEAKISEILWWLVQGAVTFYAAKERDGLVMHKKPKAFRVAMEEYISENNPIQQWINESCNVDKINLDMYVPTSLLCSRYKDETREFKMTPSVFGRHMRKMGFDNNDGAKMYVAEVADQVRVIRGISLR